MAFTKYIVPALAIASLAFADKSCEGDKTIENQEDASGLSSCSTWDGDITISNVVNSGIKIDGVQKITGSLISKNSSITELSASKLATIGDSFTINACTALRSLQFDSLTAVKFVNFEALPKLQSLGFTKGVSKANRVRITNTDLTSLTGIELEDVSDMEITNNPHLTEVNVNQITNATGYINFAANHKDLKISFPNLQSAHNMTFRNTSGVSIPSLEKMDGLLGFYSNFFMDFSASNLTGTGDLVFADNSNLNNISLPVLKTVKGAFQVANNTNLKAIDGVPKLQTVNGALDFSGKFNKVELPGLKEVRGDTNIQSTESFGCEPFDKFKSDDVIRGKLTCREKQTKPKSGTDSGSDSSTSSGAADPSAQAPAGLLIGLLGTLQFLL
ncbi:ecm33 [Arthroderma uncinatum]|uniref:ecm33 n=1 Tax=Arthroderma uncinatum TaxID=74035 RepID=UPI00144AF295|nr:ecm33 [Arthroderma uncinatum]KAF3491922.1 ecm33 [Arthroderma uncinatum]